MHTSRSRSRPCAKSARALKLRSPRTSSAQPRRYVQNKTHNTIKRVQNGDRVPSPVPVAPALVNRWKTDSAAWIKQFNEVDPQEATRIQPVRLLPNTNLSQFIGCLQLYLLNNFSSKQHHPISNIPMHTPVPPVGPGHVLRRGSLIWNPIPSSIPDDKIVLQHTAASTRLNTPNTPLFDHKLGPTHSLLDEAQVESFSSRSHSFPVITYPQHESIDLVQDSTTIPLLTHRSEWELHPIVNGIANSKLLPHREHQQKVTPGRLVDGMEVFPRTTELFQASHEGQYSQHLDSSYASLLTQKGIDPKLNESLGFVHASTFHLIFMTILKLVNADATHGFFAPLAFSSAEFKQITQHPRFKQLLDKTRAVDPDDKTPFIQFMRYLSNAQLALTAPPSVDRFDGWLVQLAHNLAHEQEVLHNTSRTALFMKKLLPFLQKPAPKAPVYPPVAQMREALTSKILNTLNSTQNIDVAWAKLLKIPSNEIDLAAGTSLQRPSQLWTSELTRLHYDIINPFPIEPFPAKMPSYPTTLFPNGIANMSRLFADVALSTGQPPKEKSSTDTRTVSQKIATFPYISSDPVPVMDTRDSRLFTHYQGTLVGFDMTFPEDLAKTQDAISAQIESSLEPKIQRAREWIKSLPVEFHDNACAILFHRDFDQYGLNASDFSLPKDTFIRLHLNCSYLIPEVTESALERAAERAQEQQESSAILPQVLPLPSETQNKVLALAMDLDFTSPSQPQFPAMTNIPSAVFDSLITTYYLIDHLPTKEDIYGDAMVILMQGNSPESPVDNDTFKRLRAVKAILQKYPDMLNVQNNM